jgi:transposase InsO family protein
MQGMPYITNPFIPKARMNAVKLVRQGWSIRKVARYTGYNPSTISRWVRIAPRNGSCIIETKSSRPRSHPRTVSDEIESAIISERLKHNRCGDVIHQIMVRGGIKVSLSTVNRVLDRHGLLKKKSKWKRFHPQTDRPLPASPGDLVETDTIHLMRNNMTRCYIYTLIDVHSRWTYAEAVERISAQRSLDFIARARAEAPFRFNCIQSDNGAEFSAFFTQRLNIRHRHTRVRKPTDNAHIERFNRTIQTECVRYPSNIDEMNDRIKSYLNYYNNERIHMGINYQTPIQKLTQVLRSY